MLFSSGVQSEFKQLVASGTTPNSFSYHKLMQSYAQQNDLENVRKVLQQAEDAGVDINKEIVETLVEACLSARDLLGALEHLDHYSKVIPSMKTFMDVMESAIKQGDQGLIDQAMSILKRTGASPDVVTHTVMFSLIRLGICWHML